MPEMPASEGSMAGVPGALPAHVAVIMDGNGRWARARGLPRTAGHKRGADALKNLMESCERAGVSYLTVYAFSAENWKRPAAEVTELMGLLSLYLSREIKALAKRGARLRFIGDRAPLSPEIRALIQDAEEETRGNARFHLTVALSYGGRQEMVRAARALAARAAAGEISPESIDESAFSACLDTHGLPEPDLLIRTGGEHRLSNFLLWQSAYTELYFTETLWPDFGEADFRAALEDYAGRERRYGDAR